MAYKDKEKARQYDKAWRDAHREHLKEWRRKYYETERGKETLLKTRSNEKARLAIPEIRDAVLARRRSSWGKPENKEKQSAYHRKSYGENRDKLLGYQKDYYYNRGGKLKVKNRDLMRNYGLTTESYSAMLNGQGGKCAICGTSDWGGRHNSPVVDHDHETGVVRGILCNNCNAAIGFMSDDPDRAIAISRYLTESVKDNE
jgi:hypothetical protein